MKYVKWILVIGYIYFILTQTIIGRAIQAEPVYRDLFWEIRNGMWVDILLNILLFIPLGFLIGDRKGVILGFVLSCGIELVQYLAVIGFCEMDDVLNNTIGSAIGVGMNAAIGKCIGDIWG